MTGFALDPLRLSLLPVTLEYAASNSTYYAQAWGESWREVQGLDDLTKLPLLDKQLALKHQQALRCGPTSHDLGKTSSGTTRVGNEMLFIERCDAEDEALRQFYDQLLGQSEQGTAEKPLVLHIVSPNHGYAGSGDENTIRLGWGPYAHVCTLVEHALVKNNNGRPVTVLQCSVNTLKALTIEFLRRGTDFSKFSLKEVVTNSATVTPRWRALFQQTWGENIVDVYSLSEFRTAASECNTCGWYHLGAPPVIAEILDLADGAPKQEGLGQLVLTGLFPYVQRQPLIRYATADIVEIGPPCPQVKERAIRFRGRMHQTPRTSTEECLLFPIKSNLKTQN
jgi:phenylacetate-coenzyme A ligase PaaK-like adenylate-forming protein